MTRISLNLRWAVGVLAIAASFLMGGCEDECSVGETRCLTDVLIRTCVKGNDDDPEWVTHACAEGTACVRSGEAVDEPSAPGGSGGSAGSSGSDGTAGSSDDDAPDGGSSEADTPDGGTQSDEEAATGTGSQEEDGQRDRCVGVCVNGVAECVTDELSRYCVDGKEWALDACEVGEICDATDGRCRLADEDESASVLACEPGAKACVSDRVEKECDADGSGWRLQGCRPWETCADDDECQPDPDQSCDVTGGGTSGACIDSKTAVRCNAITGGYEFVTCEGDTYCAGGRCRGENCNVGSVCLGAPAPQATNPAAALPTQILECVDGLNEVITECEIGEVCRQDGDEAECVPPDCTPGASVCGDPENDSVDATRYYSACVVGNNSGVPEWKLTECQGNLVCDPAAGAGNLCRSECSPGAQVCASDAAMNVVSGSRECQEDGTWGPIQDCNPSTAGQLVCMNVQDQEPGALNQVVCADPVCADIAANPAPPVNGVERVQGVCDGAQIKTCGADGKLLDEAVACETGVCRNVGAPQGDGQIRGICDVVVNCEEGETVCLNSGTAPFYQNCVNGKWGTELVRCDGDNTCWDSVDQEGLRHASCGGDCSPGSSRCDPDDETGTQLQRCDADGEWSDADTCSHGVCQLLTIFDPTANDGNGANASQVNCVLQCVPGQVYCDLSGPSKTADDGYHTGYEATRTCKPNGLWPDRFAEDDADEDYFDECDETEACRISGSGDHTGCVECIGPDIPGGNEHGFADTTCEDDQFKACDTDNNWKDPEDCSEGTTCSPPRPTTPICGPCTSGAGVDLEQCSEVLVNDTEVCGACTSAAGNTVEPCTPETVNDWEICGSCLSARSLWVTCTEDNVNDIQVCGDCTPASSGADVTCTEENVNDVEVCGNCPSASGASVICTNANVDDAGTSDSCDTLLYNTQRPQADWGGETACCGNYQQYQGDSCQSLGYNDDTGNSPAAWGGEIDCCGDYQLFQGDSCQSLGHNDDTGNSPADWGTAATQTLCCGDYQNYRGDDCWSVHTASQRDWGGVTNCCSNAWDGTTTTCGDVGSPGISSPWAGVVDCCAAAQDTLPEQDYAICVEDES